MPLSILLPGPPDCFLLYRAALRRCGALPVSAGEGACAGLLLPGGGDPDPSLYHAKSAGSHPPDLSRDLGELALIRRFAETGRPILGICRGMQMLNLFFGGTLRQDIPGHSQIGGADRLHPVRSLPGSVPAELYGPAALVNSAHHQAVERLGRGLQAVQRAGDGTVEALCHKELPILAVQWHPERLTPQSGPGAADGRLLLAWFAGQCDGCRQAVTSPRSFR